ncbi:bifunctional glycosyltransferase family 2/GtrA family protein [Actinoplanes sp. M2I2]|uniref:bifunctional glycosyltransferase family 2/GtrA family protein n=1 Tax=Actinoplanes sp. M2I2 TaxID=1734444 RepID=UPI0020208541|nr:bifunctional glycosyltransferase family 2/GtrA family protein [Actinoplanes sp. M2I2]
MIVLIPAYEPGRHLIDLVRRLTHHTVVVVDDGSGPGYAGTFTQVQELGAQVLTVPSNRGKGHALRVGFSHIHDHYPGRDVVCADSDGQHRPEDIEAVADRVTTSGAAMVLGCRRFTGPVPARSRLGNTVTRTLFCAVTGRKLTDTQTGLRAYPARMLPWLGQVDGDRFEYEQRLLLRATREGLPIAEVEIATIYLRHNASSHFRPVRDSLRIYRPLLAFSLSSMLAFALDTVALLALVTLTGNVALSAIGARLISATVNYRINRRYVFGTRGSALRYVLLAVTLLAVNVVLLEVLTSVTGSVLAAKLVAEAALFAANYLVQRIIIFPALMPAATPVLPVAPVVTTGHEPR